MKNVAFVFLATVVFSAAAFASQELVGTWKLEKMECKSGAPHTAWTGGLLGTFSAQVTFTETEMTVLGTYTLRSSAYAENNLKQIEEDLKQAEQLPDWPEKQDYLNSLEKMKEQFIAQMEKYKDESHSCETEISGSYDVNGTELSFHSSRQHSSCDQTPSTTDEQTFKYKLQVNEQTFVLTSPPESDGGHSCAKDDIQISTYSRVQ